MLFIDLLIFLRMKRSTRQRRGLADTGDDTLTRLLSELVPLEAEYEDLDKKDPTDDAVFTRREQVRKEIHGRLSRVCDAYSGASDEVRVAVRRFFDIRWTLLWFLEGNLSTSGSDWGPDHMRTGLIAISIADGRFDFRDVIMSLGELRRAASQAGFDPRPLFEDVAGISSPETGKRLLETWRMLVAEEKS